MHGWVRVWWWRTKLFRYTNESSIEGFALLQRHANSRDAYNHVGRRPWWDTHAQTFSFWLASWMGYEACKGSRLQSNFLNQWVNKFKYLADLMIFITEDQSKELMREGVCVRIRDYEAYSEWMSEWVRAVCISHFLESQRERERDREGDADHHQECNTSKHTSSYTVNDD